MTAKTQGITKTEAVRRAVQALGAEASAEDIQGYVKQHFDLEMTKAHIYTTRGQLRREEANKPSAGIEDTQAEPAPQREAAQGSEGNNGVAGPDHPTGEAVSRKEGVRRALQALGKNASAEAIQTYAREHFNLEISRSMIFRYKAQFGKKGQGRAKTSAPKTKPAREAARATQVPSAPAPAPAQATARDKGGIQVEDMQLVKSLVERVGAERLRSLLQRIEAHDLLAMIDLFAGTGSQSA